jgi:hypothetical protein
MNKAFGTLAYAWISAGIHVVHENTQFLEVEQSAEPVLA